MILFYVNKVNIFMISSQKPTEISVYIYISIILILNIILRRTYMNFFSLFKKQKNNAQLHIKEKIDTQSNINLSITPSVLQDIKTLLVKQNKSVVRIILSGFC